MLLMMVDEHFRMSEADGAVYDILNVKVRSDNPVKFVVEVETVLSRIKHGEQPDGTMKHTLVLRGLRESHALRDSVCDYERLEVGSENRNYQASMRFVRKFFETSN